MTVDNESELHKIKKLFPSAKVIIIYASKQLDCINIANKIDVDLLIYTLRKY